MNYDTINDVRTIAGNGEGALLANRYRVVRQLGQGGMGSVWLAEDTQLDNKLFAIKMLPAILVSNKRAYRQLKDEALVAMQLVHPNIVQIRAFEENDGNPFLVMDYIDGQTLDDYLADHAIPLGEAAQVGEAASRRFNSAPLGEAASRRFNSAQVGEAASRRFTGTTGVSPVAHGLPESDVLRILRPVAAALDYAHSKGVVHRDVKPGNVMIAKDGTPYILDFGIAREIQETMTRVTGKLSSGTLLYMSPEQLMGESPKPAQDIYSFAAMAYECLRGEPPFSHGQIEFQIMNKPPASLPGGPRSCAVAIMAGLAKKPESRPATCAAVLDESQTGVARATWRVAMPRDVPNCEPSHDRLTRPPVPQACRMGTPRPSSPKIGITTVTQKRKATGVVLAIVCVVTALAVLGGVLWYRAARKRQTVRRQILAQRQAEEKRQQGEEPARLAAEVASKKARAEKDAREKEEIANKRMAKESRLDAERKAKYAATKIRSVARVQHGRVEQISDADGFKARKDQLEDVFIRAEAYYDDKVMQWTGSAQLFSNYVTRAQELLKLDSDRQLAVKSRQRARDSFQAAETVGAKTYAVTAWNGAVAIWKQAATEFDRADFSSASNSFALAAEQFRACVGEAKEQRDKQIVAAREKAEREAREQERRKNWRKVGEQFTINSPYGLNLTMKWCPAGTFMMGSPRTEEGRYDNERQHEVTLTKGFWMGETEVTQGQWKKIMDGETIVDLSRKALLDDTEYFIAGKKQTLRAALNKQKYDKVFGGNDKDVVDQLPVYWVNWYDAVKFCNRLTQREREAGHLPDGYEYRLPTEAEWEYGCRANTTSALPNGLEIHMIDMDQAPVLDSIAWYRGNSTLKFSKDSVGRSVLVRKLSEGKSLLLSPQEVKGKQPNDWGLYDMIGNISEWCGDWVGDYSYGAEIDPKGTRSGECRVLRGGRWDGDARHCRSAARSWESPYIRYYAIGFRVALAPSR